MESQSSNKEQIEVLTEKYNLSIQENYDLKEKASSNY
jgi:hypothetical protein